MGSDWEKIREKMYKSFISSKIPECITQSFIHQNV